MGIQEPEAYPLPALSWISTRDLFFEEDSKVHKGIQYPAVF